MTGYQPTDEQTLALAATWLDEGQVDHPDDRAFWLGEFRELAESPAFQSIVRAVQAETLRQYADECTNSYLIASLNDRAAEIEAADV